MGARKPKRRGRPPGPPENVRRHRIAATFTDAERRQLEALAAERSVPVGTLIYAWVRRALRRATREGEK